MWFSQELQKQLHIKPALECVLEHWCVSGKTADAELGLRAAVRYTQASNWHKFVQNDSYSLQGVTRDLAEGMGTWDATLFIVGAAFYPEMESLREAVLVLLRRGLPPKASTHAIERLVAATYACSFYLDLVEEVMPVLTEQVVLADAAPSLVRAAREVLEVCVDVRGGGVCRCCHRAGETTVPAVWLPEWTRMK